VTDTFQGGLSNEHANKFVIPLFQFYYTKLAIR